MASTFEGGRVIVRTGVVEVDGTPFLVGPETRIEAVVDPPQVKVWLLLLALSLLAVPSALVAGTLMSSPGDHSWVVAPPMVLAATSIIRVLAATTRYHVALVADQRVRVVYSSDDLQTVVFLAAMVRDAIPLRQARPT